jgi:hypothetical protein
VGIRLIVEVMDHAPTTLTHREAWVLGVLAEDARDETRVTWSSVESPRMLRRARVSRPQMYEVLRQLIAKGAIKKITAGQKNGIAKYELLPMAPVQSQEIPDAEAPAQRPESPDTDAPQCPETPDVSVRESQTPTPQPLVERTNTPAPAAADAAFDAFWSAYPRKVAKGTARAAFAKALKRGADPAAITAAAARHAAQWRAAHTEARFIPHPATWLNGERYDDEPEPQPATNQPTLPGAPQRYTDPAERGVF